MKSVRNPERWRIACALAAVYVLWGSTYLAIKIAIETLPPFLMAGTRFMTAGTLLYVFMRVRGESAPTRRHWRSALIAGAFLMMASNGLVSWAEKRIDSSLAALLVGTVPLWMMLLDWIRPGGTRPSIATILGVLVGIVGVALLVWPDDGADAVPLSIAGVVALLAATFAWSIGSIYSRGAEFPRSPALATAMQMLCGGALQFTLGTAIGEWHGFDPSRVSTSSVLGVVYLLVAGSLIGFTAYIWLLRNTSPAVASSYAFVNPLVAVLLGVTFGHEKLGSRTLFAAPVIVLAVILVVLFKKVPAPAASAAEVT